MNEIKIGSNRSFGFESRKIYIENQLKFDRETARIAAFKMWENSAGGPPVFMS